MPEETTEMEQDPLASGVTEIIPVQRLPRELLRFFLFHRNYSLADTASHSGSLACSSTQL